MGFTLGETKNLVASRKRSPVAWRALAVRKSEELRLRIATEEAARQALAHALVCPNEDVLGCPNFAAMVNAVQSGAELADSHSGVHRSAGAAGSIYARVTHDRPGTA